MDANLPGVVRRPPDLTTPRARAVLDRVRAIPPGFVAAYSDVDTSAPRFVGTVLAACADPGVPWHRVVRADGSLTQGERQAALLEAEGIPLTGGPRRVDVRLARWWGDVDPA
jgi:methylated-DNA-protein-cysteine methyltransferase-like protein